jgi:endo-1,4-beta-xylanase
VTDTVNAWNTGLTESITITNTGGSTISGWKLAFTLASGQTVISTWNASLSGASGAVTASNLSYNGTIAPGGNTNFGFQATHSGNASAPPNFTLNGAACTSG